MRTKSWLILAILAACGGGSEEIPHSGGVGPAPFDPGETYAPRTTPAQLSATISNTLFPAPVGARWTYRATTDEGVESDVVEVTAETRTVWGATARVVHDTVYLNDAKIEETYDWYAQDTDGNVWYLGEDSTEFVNGAPAGTEGSWESGIGGALPGVIMLAAPTVGMVYRQEYLAGEAEDVGIVESLDEAVTVPAGSWNGCLETRERSAIDAELDEHKFYCAGVGNTLVLEDGVRVELIEYAGL
jgi:hypothetical protein